jgi:phosphatidylglycerophosphatase A
MAIKESSDELNPAVVVPQSTVAVSKEPWNPVDYLALAIATCGVGYLPLIPGTYGSLVGVGIFLLLSRTAAGLVVAIIAFTVAGIWAASRTEELAGRKDPGKVVVDEVAGQLIATLPLALVGQWSIPAVIVSFILFRFFDIVKPYPASRFERLEGGYGIMCDDLVAGVYAALFVSIFISFF